MTDNAGPELSFDRATYQAPAADAPPTAPQPAPCGNCQRPLGVRYWKWQTHVVCDACRDLISGTIAKSQSASSFGMALLKGGATALGCGIAYAVFAGLTNFRLSLITIGIGFVVAKVIRSASRGVGGRRFQVLAVALTYVASAMGYAPAVVNGLTENDKTDSASVAPAEGAASGETAKAAPPSEAKEEKVGPVQIVFGLAFVVALTLAAPFLTLTQSPMGFFIILFGLWEAWKLSRGIPMVVEGPFESAPQPAK